MLKPLVFVLALVPLPFVAWRAVGNTNPIEAAEIGTGVWALRFVALTLLITPLRRLTGWNELIRYRRMLGLFAFFYATVHLSVYVGLDMFFAVGDIVADIVKRPWITIGMATWLLLVPLAITSTSGMIRRLGGRRWRLLHRLVYLVAVGGTVHYLLAVKKDIRAPLLYVVLFAALLGYRLWMRLAPAAAPRGGGVAPGSPRRLNGVAEER